MNLFIKGLISLWFISLGILLIGYTESALIIVAEIIILWCLADIIFSLTPQFVEKIFTKWSLFQEKLDRRKRIEEYKSKVMQLKQPLQEKDYSPTEIEKILSEGELIE